MAAETAVGAKSQLAWVGETTWGVYTGSPQLRLLPFVSETIKSDIGNVENPELRSDRRSSTPIQGNLKPGGDINVAWTANAHGWMVYRALGGSVVTTGTDPYTHTIQESNSPELKSMTLEKGFLDINQYFKYIGARINRLSFTIAPEANIGGAISIMAKNEQLAATSLDNTPTDQAHIPLDSFSGTVTQAAATIATLTEMTLNIDNALAGINVVASQFYGALLAARLKVSGTFSMFFADAIQFNRYRNFTETDFIIKMQDAAANFIQFQMDNVRYMGSTPQVGGEGPVFFSGEFAAYIDTASAKQIEAVVKNNITNALFTT